MTAIEEEQNQRRHWRLRWLGSLQAFSDNETQKSRWLDTTERNPHFSFVECMCSYFDDAYLGEEDAYARRLARGHLSTNEAVAVSDFHALAQRYESPNGDDYDAEAVLGDPNWKKVVEAAQHARHRLLPLLTDSTERAALTQPLHWEERDGAFYADAIGSRIVPAGKWVAEQTSSGIEGLLGGLRRKLFRNASS